jgi:hypothetical protein
MQCNLHVHTRNWGDDALEMNLSRALLTAQFTWPFIRHVNGNMKHPRPNTSLVRRARGSSSPPFQSEWLRIEYVTEK